MATQLNNPETITRIVRRENAPASEVIPSNFPLPKVQPDETVIKLPFRLPGLVRTGLYMTAGAAMFFAWEALAPTQLKPSYNIGSYEAAIVEAQKTGELAAQARFEAKIRDIDFIQQERLKALDVAVAQNTEYYKGLVGVAGKYYEAAFQRSNMYAEKAVQMQASLQSSRLQTASQASSGLTGLAVLGDYVSAFGLMVGDRRMEEGGRTFSQQMTDAADARVTGAGASVPMVNAEGLDAELPAPDVLAMAFTQFAPPAMPALSSVSISTIMRDLEARDGGTRATPSR